MEGPQVSEVPELVDALTGLPWSAMIHAEAARLALEHDLHAVSLHLNGLSTVIDVHGAPTLVSVLRDIARHLRAQMDARDRLSRQSVDRLLLITVRPPEEMIRLVDDMVASITAAAVQVDGGRLPRVHVGIARVRRAGTLAEGRARLDAAVLSAEIIASSSRRAAAVDVAFPPSPPQPPVEEAPGQEGSRDVVPAGPPAAATPAAPAAAAAEAPLAAEPRPQAEAVERAAPPGERRIALKGLRQDLSGLVATAVVELAYQDRHAVARSVGRNVEERRLFLLGEAAARAVTDFLPPGYGAVIHDVHLVPPGAGEPGRVLAVVLFLEPEKEQFLFGVAPTNGDAGLAAARAVLDAVNRRIGVLLPQSP